MSRKEDFKKAAEDYCEDHSHCIYFEAGAEYGYQYAQTHPNWISVEDELPPPHYEGANSTDFVLVYDGYDLEFGYYDFGQKNWHGEDCKEMMFDVTHWMPIVPPRKEANDE